jgi:hypothetical protein
MDKRGEVNSTAIWLIVIFVVIVCAIVFFMVKFKDSNNSKQISVSQDVLLSGISLTLAKGDSFIIDFAGKDYNFILNKLDSEEIWIKDYKNNTIELRSNPLSFDLNEDGLKDIIVTLNVRNTNNIEIFVESSLIGGTCIESWTCSDWSICFDSAKKRICVDSNSCGGELNKPVISENC